MAGSILYHFYFQLVAVPELGHSFAAEFLGMQISEGEKQMAGEKDEREIMGAEETSCEVRLWQAVVVRTIEDWMSGPLRQRRLAEHYIFGKSTDFGRVCESAGLNADDLRARLTKIRSRQLQAEQRIAA